MHIYFNLIFFVIIGKLKCQQVLNEELFIFEQKAGEKVNISKTNIDRRFLEDLDDYEWHVAHLRGAIFDGRRDCREDTFADKVRRYRKMLRSDGARVNFVSSDPIIVNPADIVQDTCKVGDDFLDDDLDGFYNLNKTIKVTSANFINVTNNDVNIVPTTVAQNITTVVNATVSMKVADTTPMLDFKATTLKSKVNPILPKKKKMDNKLEKKTENNTLVRRASEYMFSSPEYYDESVEFNNQLCPDTVEVIDLEIDQLRSYDLECELTTEWRSLE